ncbi:uncharacterized protein BDW43DRAFT_314282 [Aspergillus alliaceus]|uniref:uncharacterized protein n=1 Tax=Petromyces alliaceus TaxID=209559 RepID=UPI0012A42DF6|nr:uncharacterized protein BDW43DRAFT_314282 [Aspergillus alliaceus]KAB8230229.1 hypothetical protein BDW43DRAFT_314282 [Aspergillus alliaceus]
MTPHIPRRQVDERLRDLWDELIHAAQALQAPSAEFDRLVTLALEARELGPYVRKKEAGISDEVQEEAILPNGQYLWTDLPYLVQEFEDAWAKESMGYTAKERESLARKRFKDLHLYGNEQIAKMARACFEEAILTGFGVGLDIPREEKYLEKLFGMLDAELAARDLKGSVGPEGVEINKAWADED